MALKQKRTNFSNKGRGGGAGGAEDCDLNWQRASFHLPALVLQFTGAYSKDCIDGKRLHLMRGIALAGD
jgi:hypothetical protein